MAFHNAGEGACISYLAKATGSFPTVPIVKGDEKPRFAGDPKAYLAAQSDPASVEKFMFNKVKVCGNCSKPNAFTLSACNACGTSLVDTPISHTNNCFMGFVFGIEKGPFPFTLSIRYQDEQFLVLDDLLALAPLHFNVIPTTQHIPDWRYLLRRPKEGKELIDAMVGKCQHAASEQFLNNKAWTDRVLKQPMDLNDLIAGFNYPPSQYQLHIQFIAPPLIPFQYAQMLKGIHFTAGRFFPYPYVRRCLELAEGAPLPAHLLQEDTNVADIIEHFRTAHGFVYMDALNETVNKFAREQTKYAKWGSEDFAGYVTEHSGVQTFVPFQQPYTGAPVDPKTVVNDDKMALQNYGRPYTDEGRPKGWYYSYAKTPQDLTSW